MRTLWRVAVDGTCWLVGQLLALATIALVLWTLLWAWYAWEARAYLDAAELTAAAVAWVSVPLAFWFVDDLRRSTRKPTAVGTRPAAGSPRGHDSEDEEQKNDHDD